MYSIWNQNHIFEIRFYKRVKNASQIFKHKILFYSEYVFQFKFINVFVDLDKQLVAEAFIVTQFVIDFMREDHFERFGVKVIQTFAVHFFHCSQGL